ncbi:MAG: hypothetical protein JSU77_11700 [Fidelibacterota bacterium]|nr:MAG: hypothetical protein JSU77_11700 [Candidatus Neomarinimicrobiota bacterium]
MIRPALLLAIGLLLAPAAQGQQDKPFHKVVDAFLINAPIKMNYHYTIARGNFRQDTSGTLVLIGPGVFRLELWDKVYGSDGSSLYLHDRNTHQTVIDSLRWTEVNLWVRLLHGELPARTVVTPCESTSKGATCWELSHEEPWWQGVVETDTTTWAIREILLHEEPEWQHLVRLDIPEPWNNANPDSFIALEDLPGTRLDLR